LVLAWFVPSWGLAVGWALLNSVGTNVYHDDGAGERFVDFVSVCLLALPVLGVFGMVAARGGRRKRVAGLVVCGATLIMGGVWYAQLWSDVTYRVRCGRSLVGPFDLLRTAFLDQVSYTQNGDEFPWSLGEQCYTSEPVRGVLTDWCDRAWSAQTLVGPYSFQEVGEQRMPLAELLAEFPKPDGWPKCWERFGPLVMYMDAGRLSNTKWPDPLLGEVIMGWIVWDGEDWAGRCVAVIFGDNHSEAADAVNRLIESGCVEKTVEFFSTLGTPMPEELVAELRELLKERTR